MQLRPIIAIVAIAVAASLSGCVVSVAKCKDEKRSKVRFATARSAQIFYDAALLPHGPNTNGRLDIKFALHLPISIGTWKTKNVTFNQAIREADINHDGIIMETEAKRFAKQTEEQSTRDAHKFFRHGDPTSST